MVMTLVTGSRYLGGFIGDTEAESPWLERKVQGWEELERMLSGVSFKHPQSAYAGLKKSLQQE